ncbi:MAG: RIP metalloprotease RseP, partial [Spirulina sp.]
MSVLAAIGVLALLIVVHELGHFAAARLQNIHVNRFSIGFGPVLVKYQGSQTEYAIRAFPLGGFVGFPDDDPDSDIPPDDPDLLRNRPILDRAIVISAGVIANLVFAYFLLSTQVITLGYVNYQPGVIITDVVAEPVAVAQKAGIEAGDIILSIDSHQLEASVSALPE